MINRCAALSIHLALIAGALSSLACAPHGGSGARGISNDDRVSAPATPSATSLPSTTPDAPPASGARRAIWIWEEDSFKLLDDASYRDETLAFLERQKVSVLYLYADVFRGRNVLRNEPAKYRRFIAHAHRRGFEVYALLGSYYLNTPEYILPEKRREAVRMFRSVLDYDAAADTGARFDGVNIDIEPYLLDDWNAKKTLRARQYLDLAAEFMRMKREAGSALSVGPAMPFWFDGIEDLEWNGRRRRLSEHTQDVYDYVAIMDYRNFAEGRDGIISHAGDELAYADSVGRKVVIGLETLRTEPAKVTFFGKGRVVFERELGLAERAFSSHPSFDGFAIHHLEPYRVLAGDVRER